MRTLLILIALAGACSSKAPDRKLRVAAAANMTNALAELKTKFQAKTGVTVEIEMGSSGELAKKIEQGAPIALFIAANKGFADQVVKAGKCDGTTERIYARGRLVVWTPTKVAPPKALADLADPRFTKIAIANPETAPYGKAAKQALEKSGLWPQIQDRIVVGNNIEATLTYAKTGNVEAALVALSLVVSADGGSYIPVDGSLHAPIDQALVVCGSGPEAEDAKQFADYIGSAEGHELMGRYGFGLPGELAEGPAAPAGSGATPAPKSP